MQERGECVRAFLLAPLSRRGFGAFFELCCATTVGVLKYYRSRGYPVPIERADAPGAYHDLACEILGEFFARRTDEPCGLVFDYFARHGVTDFETLPADELYIHFRVLLSGFVKKHLFHRRKTENPQAEILKRRVKDILGPPAFVRFRGNPSGHLMVARADREGRLRSHAPPLPQELVLDIAAQTFRESHTRTAWCRAVFERIDEELEYRNCVRLGDLLLAMVEVNAAALEEVVPQASATLSPELDAVQRTIECGVRETVAWASLEIIAPFVVRGRLQPDDRQAYLRAVEMYLLDLAFSGGTDPIPRYFREVMPAARHASYLADHKYTFEAVISRSVEHFRELLAGQVT